MKIEITGKVSEDPRDRVLAIEEVTKAICQQTGQDPAEGVMMLLTAAVHLSNTYSRLPISEVAPVMAECLGHAIVAADDFFKLRTISEPAPSPETKVVTDLRNDPKSYKQGKMLRSARRASDFHERSAAAIRRLAKTEGTSND